MRTEYRTYGNDERDEKKQTEETAEMGNGKPNATRKREKNCA